MTHRTLHLIRHAQYASTTTPPDEPDGGLTPAGKEQAAFTAQRLHALPINAIHYSPAQRAAETAAIFAAHLPGAALRPSPLLRECIPWVPPADSLSEVERAFYAQIPREFLEAGGPQAQQAFETYFQPAGDERHEVLVSHGNLICYLVSRVLGAPPEGWRNTDIRHCGISEVLIRSNGRTMLRSHNDAEHLPQHLRTYV